MKEFLESAYEEEFARESLGILKHEIESAHLMNPLWPSDFGCPDLPARDVLSPRYDLGADASLEGGVPRSGLGRRLSGRVRGLTIHGRGRGVFVPRGQRVD